MKQLILCCLCAMILFSCSDGKDTPAPAVLINSYATKYMVHPKRGAFYTHLGTYTLEYKNGKVNKRTGVPECIVNGSCQEQPAVIDEVSYGDNIIRIANKSSMEDWGVLQEEWLYGLKNHDQPAYLIYKAENRRMYDSLSYIYHTDGKLNKIEGFSIYRDEVELVVNRDIAKDFFFDASGNLERVETRRILDDDGFVLYVIVEKFDNYDNAVNPFKGMFMFEDTYYRSLSQNNFRRYRREEIEVRSGAMISSHGKDWVLEYDAAGRPVFDKP
ncbi:hypothetical protein [uncultured Pontibacter sp.]|uniref:hypothetical protein n=1 Tax=uncultured Pontibacter sp. TaxID=453356 RepID=UPI0026335114|nr:hypothetical protein [uncultured Pontibacter sp.]